MRNISAMLAVTLLLVPAAARAQTPASPAATPASTPAMSGQVELGGQVSSVDGDEARFERYRDSRNRAFSGLSFSRIDPSYFVEAGARQIGNRDQRYDLLFRGSRLDFSVQFAGTPLNYSYLTRTPYIRNGSTLLLDDAAQRAVQGPTSAPADGTAVGVPCAPGAPPASCSSVALANQAKANRSIYNSLAEQFDLRHTRNTANVGVSYRPTGEVDVDAHVTVTNRNGEQPWGASFAFNNAVELPKPIDERTNDFTVGGTWANDRSMFRLAWDGSWYTNQFKSLIWDNPSFLTDYNNGLVPPNGPYDPSGYSNGNGPARGQLALPPNNYMNVVSATGLHRFWTRTSVNGTVQVSSQNQDEQLIPWTTNPLINSPLVLAAFPHLQQLPRASAEAEARGLNTLINLSSRAWRPVNVNVRYRYNKRDVRTPVFDATEYVRFDAVPEENPEGFSPQFDNSRQLFDANVSFTPGNVGTVRVGYGHEGIERHGRGYADVGEHIFRLSYDAYSNQFVTVRANLEAGRRRGQGFVEAESGNDEADPITGPGGTQPTLRYYDEADRNRARGSVVVTVMPVQTVDAFFQITSGKDTYKPDDTIAVSRPGELFGLQEQSMTGWNVGVNFHPGEAVGVGASYGRDAFSSLQRSRNANPPPDPTWTDPNRDWLMDNDDGMNNANVYVDILRAIRNTDIRLAYDYNDSDNRFGFGGPRIATLAAAGQFIALPNVENTWHRLTADVRYYFTPRVGVGVGYYFEKLDVTDWNTIDTNGPVGFAAPTGDPRIDWLGALTTGYGNRPYSGHTATLRLLYRF